MENENIANRTIAIFNQAKKTEEEVQKLNTSNQDLLEEVKEILFKKAMSFMDKMDNFFCPILKASIIPMVENYSFELQGESIIYKFSYHYGELSSSLTIEPIYNNKSVLFVSQEIKITERGFTYSYPELSKEISFFAMLLPEFDKLCKDFENNFSEAVSVFAKGLLNNATNSLDRATKNRNALNMIIEKNVKNNCTEN